MRRSATGSRRCWTAATSSTARSGSPTPAATGPLGSQAAYGTPTLVVAAAATELPPASTDVVTAPWRRNEHGALTGVKSTSYAENVRGLAYARAHDCGETIFLNTAGNVCEGTGTNVFCVFGGEVVTPPLSRRPAGRDHPRAAARVGAGRRARPDAGRGAGADEVFLTSSLRDVQLVERWDGHAFTGLGAVTARMAAAVRRAGGRAISTREPAPGEAVPRWGMVASALRGRGRLAQW